MEVAALEPWLELYIAHRCYSDPYIIATSKRERICVCDRERERSKKIPLPDPKAPDQKIKKYLDFELDTLSCK